MPEKLWQFCSWAKNCTLFKTLAQCYSLYSPVESGVVTKWRSSPLGATLMVTGFLLISCRQTWSESFMFCQCTYWRKDPCLEWLAWKPGMFLSVYIHCVLSSSKQLPQFKTLWTQNALCYASHMAAEWCRHSWLEHTQQVKMNNTNNFIYCTMFTWLCFFLQSFELFHPAHY